MLDEARDAIGKGKDVIQDHVSDIVDVAAKKGKLLAEQARKQGIGLLALAARHGLNLLEDLADVATKNIPRKRRSTFHPGKFLIGVAAIAAIGYWVVSANRAEAPLATSPTV